MDRYSALPAVRQVAAILTQHGIRRFVLCPGSRNSPLVNTLSAMPNVECRAATDERSAGFMALGWVQQSRAAVALVVTSGSALLNTHPAVAEAHYMHLPLLVLSADRPQAWIGQQDGQTLPQAGVYGALVRFSAQLPEGDSPEERWYRNRLVNEAALALRHHGQGPVHLNIPLHEPLFELVDAALPKERIIDRIEFASMGGDEEELLVKTVKASKRRMILVGQHPMPPALTEALQQKGFVIVAEHLGNLSTLDGAVTNPDFILGPRADAALSPDLLITVGGCIVSKRLKRLLRKNPPRHHWHMSRDGAVVDTFCCLSLCLEGLEEELWDLLEVFADDMQEGSEQEAFFLRWHEHYGQVLDAASLPYGAPRLVGLLMEQLAAPACLHLANSSALRFAQLFALAPAVELLCNRGVNGIEGSLSTAIGFAAGDDRLNFLIIGDLSFFYDMNALGLACLSANLRILLLNNGCGGIFEMLPGIKQHEKSDAFVLAQHAQDAQAWAESRGLHYQAVRKSADWAEAQALLLDEAAGPVLVEAFVDAQADAQTMKQILKQSLL